MNATIIDGKALATEIRADILKEVIALKAKGVTPGLAVILVGDNPASHTYVTLKVKACQDLGIHSVRVLLPAETKQAVLIDQIDAFNQDDSIHGILVQMPLPKQIDPNAIIAAISPKKDVDGLHPMNVGKMTLKQDGFTPCTPLGILRLVQQTGMTIAGKHVVVIGRSNLVGRPAGQLFLNHNATVTFTHSHTKNLAEITRQADILIVAVGQAKLITSNFVKPGAIVIDVGTNRDEHNKPCGDVDFAEVKDIAGYITPVPGGVGPMTITMLMHNTVKAAKKLG